MLALGIYLFRSSFDGSASDKHREQGFVMEEYVNRPGFDLAVFALKEPRLELCAEQCRKEFSCNAFTFVKPLVPGAAAMCYLKAVAAAPIVDKLCTTGVKGR